jgi:anion-transporting  ArsA/GET3 family ATPase
VENAHALLLIERSNLDPKDKQFLKTHLDITSDNLNSMEAEILFLRDALERNKVLDFRVVTVKENLISKLENCKDEDLKRLISELLTYIRSFD